MPSRSWLRTVGGMLSDRLDRLSLTIAHVKQRLRSSLTELLSQFVSETVQDTLAATLTRFVRPVQQHQQTQRLESYHQPMWNHAHRRAWDEDYDPWQNEVEEDEFAEQQANQQQEKEKKLAESVEIGCEMTACLLKKGWVRAISIPTAVGVGLFATVASYVTKPWLGAGIALAASGLQFLSFVQTASSSSH